MEELSYNHTSVELVDVSKSYRKVKALDSISFSVKKGELFGIVGPDGAGKTTLFRLMTTLLLPDSGHITVDGYDTVRDYKAIRGIVGYMPGRFSLYPDLSVKENIDFFASVFGTTIKANYELIGDIYCRLEPFSDRKAAKLSGGMKQKLALCCALIHAPSVLFLDEPTTGVDPSSRREFWDILSNLKKMGITILVSTAYMDEANKCDKVAMMQNGRFLANDAPKNIVESFDRVLYSVSSDNMYKLLHDLRSIEGIESCYTFGSVHHIVFPKGGDIEIDSMRKRVEELGHTNVSICRCAATMEDCFMNLDRK